MKFKRLPRAKDAEGRKGKANNGGGVGEAFQPRFQASGKRELTGKKRSASRKDAKTLREFKGGPHAEGAKGAEKSELNA